MITPGCSFQFHNWHVKSWTIFELEQRGKDKDPFHVLYYYVQMRWRHFELWNWKTEDGDSVALALSLRLTHNLTPWLVHQINFIFIVFLATLSFLGNCQNIFLVKTLKLSFTSSLLVWPFHFIISTLFLVLHFTSSWLFRFTRKWGCWEASLGFSVSLLEFLLASWLGSSSLFIQRPSKWRLMKLLDCNCSCMIVQLGSIQPNADAFVVISVMGTEFGG